MHTFKQNLRRHTINKLISLPLSFFERTHSGDIMTKISNDLDSVGSIYSWSFFRFLLAIFYGLGVFALLDEKPDMSSDSGIISQQDPVNMTIECKKLKFQYPEQASYAIDDITCQFPSGEITTVIGHSGSGKSTLIKLLLSFYQVSQGSITLGDVPYSSMQLPEIRRCFAYVPQSVHLFYDTIEANIRCGNETASLEDVIAASKSAKAHNFIMKKSGGYQSMVQEHGTNFSGGEKQRIAIARAILKNAPVIILDEATSAIDSKNESYMHEYIKQQKAIGKTILVIAHRKSALRMSDYVITLDNGKIVQQTTGLKESW